MEEKELSAKESLDIIQDMISQAKYKYENNGLTILVWGLLVFIAGVTQYIMIENGNGAKSYYAWIFTMIPGFIITFIAKANEGKQRAEQNLPQDHMGLIWAMVGVMAMLTGFVFNDKFGIGFTTMMYAPFCIAGFATGLYLKDKLLISMSILAVIMSYAALFVEYKLHPLVASAIALVLMIIPGIKFYSNYKKRNRV